VGGGDGLDVRELGPWVGVLRDVGGSVTETVGVVLEGCNGKGRRVSLDRVEGTVVEPSLEWRRRRKMDEMELRKGELWNGIVRGLHESTVEKMACVGSIRV
jgi:hypothetical protein